MAACCPATFRESGRNRPRYVVETGANDSVNGGKLTFQVSRVSRVVSRASRRVRNRRPYEKGRSSSGDSSWYSSWSDVCHKTSLGCRCPIPIVGDSCPSSTATVFGSSSFHLSIERRRAFMKKLPTVVGSRPSCLAIVTCISFDGLFVSCNVSFLISHFLSFLI